MISKIHKERWQVKYNQVKEAHGMRKGWDQRKKRWRRILLLRGQGQTLQVIGDSLGISRERVRQLEREAIHMQAMGVI